MTSHDLSQAEQIVWRSFLTASQDLITASEAELTLECNLCLSEYEVLQHLTESSTHSMRMTELAVLARLSPSGLTRRFDLMIKRGFVTRERCASDRRGVIALITPEGMRQVELAKPAFNRVQQQLLFSQLSPSAAAQLQKISESISRACVNEELLATG